MTVRFGSTTSVAKIGSLHHAILNFGSDRTGFVTFSCFVTLFLHVFPLAVFQHVFIWRFPIHGGTPKSSSNDLVLKPMVTWGSTILRNLHKFSWFAVSKLETWTLTVPFERPFRQRMPKFQMTWLTTGLVMDSWLSNW